MDKQKVLLRENEERLISSREELQNILDFRKENDYWKDADANMVTVVGLPPIMDENNPERDVTLTSEEKSDILACVNKLGVWTSDLTKESLYIAYPIRDVALKDVCARAGVFGPRLTNIEDKPFEAALPSAIKAKILNYGLACNSRRCQLLVRDEAVVAMKSDKYVIFNIWEIIPNVEKALREVFPELEYVDGSIGDDGIYCNYYFNATIEEANVAMRLTTNGEEYTVKSGVLFKTSDTGSSAVCVRPFFELNGRKLPLGERKAMEHREGVSAEKYFESLKEVASSLQEMSDTIEEMANLDIEFPKNCLLNLCKDSQLPAKVAETKILPDDCTALDIYIVLTEIVEEEYTDTNDYLLNLEKVSKLRNIQLFKNADKED